MSPTVNRRRAPPSAALTERGSLQKAHHATVDSVLKDFKLLSRRLSTMATAMADETQILDRLHYKSKNQHRSSLFSRRVSEVRRYSHRLEDFQICGLVDDLRQSFFGKMEGSNHKQMKGSWSHYPDELYVSHVRANMGSVLMLLKKTHTVLCKAFKSFSLAMQTGAFIQLILTLTAITSRLATLVEEMIELVKLVIPVVDRVLAIFKLEITGTEKLTEPATSRSALTMLPESSVKPLVTIERKVLVKPSAVRSGEQPRKKKKIKKDAIDDIFGF
ncbi:hypothetical protein BT96DRAFT_927583 [Gymnopus androsaceus JB14]|uniref:Nucleolus and neural progenitor protein-like N-terminal domain-containing protein n=1 Tax=Gymnopus androsaceus JB14 TaxID=1447944 RepID=A0A6A4GNX6_9AGAR|nr:hypothetical protein BT96DRAFT_927583 [Gymnopus androsaceus JB14]